MSPAEIASPATVEAQPQLSAPGNETTLRSTETSNQQPQTTSDGDGRPSEPLESPIVNRDQSLALNPPAVMDEVGTSPVIPRSLDSPNQTRASAHSSSSEDAIHHNTTNNLSSSVTTNGAPSSATELSSPVAPNARISSMIYTEDEIRSLGEKQRSATGPELGSNDMASTMNDKHSIERFKSSSLSNLLNDSNWPDFSIPADAGVGLKARRSSTSVPDNIIVDTCKLRDEFVSTSMIPGKRGKVVGKGAYATVKIMYKKGAPKHTCYAVKEFRKPRSKENKEEYLKQLKSEFSIANSLNHPNVVKTVRLCTQSGRFNQVMEYCNSGDLFTLVKKRYLKQDDILCLFKQLLHGVSYLHRNGIAHRDIKLDNLLLTDQSCLKITDFGVSEVFSGLHPGLPEANGQCGKQLGEIRKSAPGICGSLPYVAPEVLAKKDEYDPRHLDTWSCGIVGLSMSIGGLPWMSAEGSEKNYARFLEGWNKYLADHPDGIVEYKIPFCGVIFNTGVPQATFRRLLLKMLNPEPSHRITIDQALQDCSVRSVNCCCKDTTIAVKRKSEEILYLHNHLPPSKFAFLKRFSS